jgi:HSP20 family protein
MTKAENRTPANGTRPVNYLSPLANIHERTEGYVLEAEMPGVNKEGLEVTVDNNELTILGHRTDEALAGEVVYRESRAWDYKRVFELDPEIDASNITAKMEQGILTLTLPKTERVKPRKISVE